MPPDAGPPGVVVLGAVAVILAALMFPAAGLGQLPAGPVDPATDPPAPVSTPADSTPASTPAEDTGDATDTPTDEPPETADTSETDTPPETETPTASSPSSTDDSPGGLVALLLWLLVLPAGLVITFEGKYRRWPLFRRLPIPAVSLFTVSQSVAQGTMTTLVGLSTTIPGLLRGLGSATSGFATALGSVLSGVSWGVVTLTVGIPRGLSLGLGGLVDALAGLRSATSTDWTPGGSEDDETPTGPAPSESTTEERQPPATIEDAWLRMVEALSIDGWRTKTPGELGRIAIDRGFPEQPVQRLTDAFRRVTYGGYDRDAETTDEAVSAYERIKRALGGDR